MARGDPPAAHVLASLPPREVAGRVLHRIMRAEREDQPWFFASTPGQGRFDLPTPHGACYTACSAVGAALEVFQDWTGQLPRAEPVARRRAQVTAPAGSPMAADLADAGARGAGVTVALWGGGGSAGDRTRTQAWAAAVHGAGWRALHHGIQHDTTGTERAFTLLDTAGAHEPYADPAWLIGPDGTTAVHTVHDDHDDHDLEVELLRYRIHIVDDTTLDLVNLDAVL